MIRLSGVVFLTAVFILALALKSTNKNTEFVRDTFTRIRKAHSGHQSKILAREHQLFDESKKIISGFDEKNYSFQHFSQQYSIITSDYLRFVESTQMESQWQTEQFLFDMERAVEDRIVLSRKEYTVQHALWQIHNIRRQHNLGLAATLQQFREDFVAVFENELKTVWSEIEIFKESIPMLREYWRRQVQKLGSSIESDLHNIELVRQIRGYMNIDGMLKEYEDSIGALLSVEKSWIVK